LGFVSQLRIHDGKWNCAHDGMNGIGLERPWFGTLLRTYFQQAFNSRLNLDLDSLELRGHLNGGSFLVLFIFMFMAPRILFKGLLLEDDLFTRQVLFVQRSSNDMEDSEKKSAAAQIASSNFSQGRK
jgi:hypothetical protein